MATRNRKHIHVTGIGNANPNGPMKPVTTRQLKQLGQQAAFEATGVQPSQMKRGMHPQAGRTPRKKGRSK